MKRFISTLSVEIIKVKKSKISWVSALFFIAVCGMMGILAYVQMSPQSSGTLIGNNLGVNNSLSIGWMAYFKILMQGITGAGVVGIGFITVWVFGREYADKTIKDLLAQPVSRGTIVLAKFSIIFLWASLLTFIYFICGILFGFAIGLSNVSIDLFLHFGKTFAITVLMIILLSSLVALLTNISKGYFLPIGFVIFSIILANFSGMIGIGPYYPYAIPGIYGLAPEASNMQLTSMSYIIVLLTSAEGFIGTLLWWKYADFK